MKTAAEHEWSKFLKFYTKMFAGRPTRLGVLENANGTTIDYWLEDGLPFVGIDMDPDGNRPSFEISVGELTHTIRNVRKLTAYFSSNETENGLDIADVNGNSTILRFETQEITESRFEPTTNSGVKIDNQNPSSQNALHLIGEEATHES